MAIEISDLDELQSEYKAAVDTWVESIRDEESLASQDHSVAEIDKWEEAHDAEDALRDKAKVAKKNYEDALREKFFHF